MPEGGSPTSDGIRTWPPRWPTPEELTRLAAAIEYAEIHPGEWNQAFWITQSRDGTRTMCLAGIVTHLNGWTPVKKVWSTVDQVEKAGRKELVGTVAAELLGIDRLTTVRKRLFASDLTLDGAWEIHQRLVRQVLA